MIDSLCELAQRLVAIAHARALVNLLCTLAALHLLEHLLGRLVNLRLPLVVGVPVRHNLNGRRIVEVEIWVSGQEASDQDLGFCEGDGVGVCRGSGARCFWRWHGCRHGFVL